MSKALGSKRLGPIRCRPGLTHGSLANLYFVHCELCSLQIEQTIHGSLRKAQIHALRRAIHGLCKIMLYAQHMHCTCTYKYMYMYMYLHEAWIHTLLRAIHCFAQIHALCSTCTCSVEEGSVHVCTCNNYACLCVLITSYSVHFTRSYSCLSSCVPTFIFSCCTCKLIAHIHMYMYMCIHCTYMRTYMYICMCLYM